MALGIATISISFKMQGKGSTIVAQHEQIVSGVTQRTGLNNGYISATSMTLPLGSLSGFNHLYIKALSRNSTAPSGLFIFFSGNEYNSCICLSNGAANILSPFDSDRGIHVYAPGGGMSFEYAGIWV